MSLKRLALVSTIAAAVLGFGASPALAQIPLQPAAPAPAASTPGTLSGKPVYVPAPTAQPVATGSSTALLTGSASSLSAAIGGGGGSCTTPLPCE